MIYPNHPNEILIEKYRNFEIYFNTEDETFHSVSDYYDTEQKKKSYATAKKAIDEWIKANSEFRPFFVIDFGTYRRKNTKYNFPTSNDTDIVTITGIRKDKRFVAGVEQISEYDEKCYCLPLPENQVIFDEMAPIIEEIELYEAIVKQKKEELTELSKRLTIVTLKDHKKNITI